MSTPPDDAQREDTLAILVHTSGLGSSPILDLTGESERKNLLLFASLIIFLSTGFIIVTDDKVAISGTNFIVKPSVLIVLLFILATYSAVSFAVSCHRCWQAWSMRHLLWKLEASALASG